MKCELVPAMLMGTRVTLPGQIVSILLVSSEASSEEPQDATDGVDLNGADLNWRYSSL